MPVTIREKDTGAILAQGEIGRDVVKYEGNLYFIPEAVTTDRLRVTDRTYTCPYKGTCNWVDYEGPDGTSARNVAWVYPTTRPGHELIAGRYGFYPGNRGATRQD
jgi:uncharacterized protein (DUF427 family)